MSLAGTQEKIAVGVKNGKIALIKGGAPTTHIIKLIIEDSAHNELFCMRLAKSVSLETPHSEIRFADNIPFFLVERYDRIVENEKVRRLHQADLCQALGIASEFKYEREGGPGIIDCQELLKRHVVNPAAD